MLFTYGSSFPAFTKSAFSFFVCYFPFVLLFQIPVSSWFDDMSDRELLDVLPLLDRLAKEDDVYKILRRENHNHIVA